MHYNQIIKAEFVERPNRFIAKVIVDGEVVTSHVRNTGRCRELLVPGCTVYLEDFAGRMGTRKLRYSLIAVEKGSLLINMDSQAPNKVCGEALAGGLIKIPGLGKLTTIRREVTHGDSRYDFYLEDYAGKKAFVEVKGVTLENQGVCAFPDAPTERGLKHIEGLIKARGEGYLAAVVFIVQMSDMKYMVPNDETHPAFGEALRRAEDAGVEVLAYECEVTPCSLEVEKQLEVRCGF